VTGIADSEGNFSIFVKKRMIYLINNIIKIIMPITFLLFTFDLDPSFSCLLLPVYNAYDDKKQILSENKGKSGIYIFTNLINGQKYIGSAQNLQIRFYKYFSIYHLKSYNNMNICKALLKYGYSNFSLEILEYCDPSELLKKEKYYFKLLKPEYNIALDPTAPMLGLKHSDETRKKISDTMSGKLKVKGSGRPAQKIEVTDLVENTTISYNSICEAARALEVDLSIITKYFRNNQKKPYKNRYIFKKVF
jgi:hypothetical protein